VAWRDLSVRVHGALVRGRRPLPRVLLALGYAVLLLTWAMSNPPGAAPDEPEHYIKLEAIAQGDLVGQREPAAARNGAGDELFHLWNQTTRGYDIPGRLAPIGLACNAFHPDQPAACLDGLHADPRTTVHAQTYVGAYEPFAYLPGAGLARFGTTPVRALLLGRLGTALLCAALLTLAALALGGGGSVAVVGLLVAATPMVLFLGGQLGTSGVEACAALAYVGGMLALTRPGRAGSALAWVAFAAGGASLATARALGPVWVALGLTLPLLLLGVRGTLQGVRQAGWRSLAAGAVVLAGVAADLLGWRGTARPGSLHPLSDSIRDVRAVFNGLPALLREQVGVFGWLDTPLPRSVGVLWGLLVVGLMGVGLLAARGRERLALAAVAAGVVPITCVFGAVIGVEVGSAPYVQGRYLLAVTVVLPLVAGEMIGRHRDRLAALRLTYLPAVIAAAAGVAQAFALYVNARRYAVGLDGPYWFFAGSVWRPPRGWAVWVPPTLVGAALIALAGLLVSRRADELPGSLDPSRHRAGAAELQSTSSAADNRPLIASRSSSLSGGSSHRSSRLRRSERR
jgi:hypothetical protein